MRCGVDPNDAVRRLLIVVGVMLVSPFENLLDSESLHSGDIVPIALSCLLVAVSCATVKPAILGTSVSWGLPGRRVVIGLTQFARGAAGGSIGSTRRLKKTKEVRD